MGNSASCNNANNENLKGITLNEKINTKTGKVESIFTFTMIVDCYILIHNFYSISFRFLLKQYFFKKSQNITLKYSSFTTIFV
jgi:hypothetical protein